MSNESVRPVIMPGHVNVWKNIIYGGIAGVAGSLATFPIDTAKTRLQEQVNLKPGETFKAGSRYTGIFDCIFKMIKHEGLRAPYRGLPIQLIGIIPEKALKLSINDGMRYKLRNPDGSIGLFWEAVAGGVAGFCQVTVTSPMEMYKIRMQLQNRKPIEQRIGAIQVAKNILKGGLPAIYQGVTPTLLRDVTFSLLYFPMYSNMKLGLAGRASDHPVWGLFRRENSDHKLEASDRVNLLGSFVSGFGAGSLSAVAVTPQDVIKTRLQSESGKQKYGNIVGCVRMTYAEGGVKAFFKGASGRFILIGPLFGVVLATYEFMPRILPL